MLGTELRPTAKRFILMLPSLPSQAVKVTSAKPVSKVTDPQMPRRKYAEGPDALC